jgi:hypothetical protein
MLTAAAALGAVVVAGGALSPNAPAAEAATANVPCSTQTSSVSFPAWWGSMKPMIPISSAGSTDCLLVSGNSGGGVTALQNGLAFTDYSLRAGHKSYEYARILVGSDALEANNWGIDGNFGDKTYRAVKRFQENKKLANDGKFGNDMRHIAWVGHSVLTGGYKYLIQNVYKAGSTWHHAANSAKKVYAYNYG